VDEDASAFAFPRIEVYVRPAAAGAAK